MLASGHPKLLAAKPLCLHHHSSMEVYSCLSLRYFLHVHSMLRNRVGATRNAFAVEVAGLERKAGQGTWIPGPALPSTVSSASLPFFQFCGYFKDFPASGPWHMLLSHVQSVLSYSLSSELNAHP